MGHKNKFRVEKFDGSVLVISIGDSDLRVGPQTGQFELNELYSALKLATDAVAAVSNSKQVLEQQILEQAMDDNFKNASSVKAGVQ